MSSNREASLALRRRGRGRPGRGRLDRDAPRPLRPSGARRRAGPIRERHAFDPCSHEGRRASASPLGTAAPRRSGGNPLHPEHVLSLRRRGSGDPDQAEERDRRTLCAAPDRARRDSRRRRRGGRRRCGARRAPHRPDARRRRARGRSRRRGAGHRIDSNRGRARDRSRRVPFESRDARGRRAVPAGTKRVDIHLRLLLRARYRGQSLVLPARRHGGGNPDERR